jgi:hypothetical protein
MKRTIPQADLLETFYIEDVTEDEEKLRVAFQMISNAYSRFSSASIDSNEVYQDLCADIYHRTGRARTVLLTGYNPDKGQREALGTVRYIVGSHMQNNSEIPPFEAMELMSPSGGWEQFTFAGFNLGKSIEFGRLSISPECRNRTAEIKDLHLLVMRQLLIGSFQLAAKRYGISQVWCIMPSYVVRALAKAGIRSIPAPNFQINHRENAHLFQKYDRYWIHSTPCFYKLDMDNIERFPGVLDSHRYEYSSAGSPADRGLSWCTVNEEFV